MEERKCLVPRGGEGVLVQELHQGAALVLSDGRKVVLQQPAVLAHDVQHVALLVLLVLLHRRHGHRERGHHQVRRVQRHEQQPVVREQQVPRGPRHGGRLVLLERGEARGEAAAGAVVDLAVLDGLPQLVLGVGLDDDVEAQLLLREEARQDVGVQGRGRREGRRLPLLAAVGVRQVAQLLVVQHGAAAGGPGGGGLGVDVVQPNARKRRRGTVIDPDWGSRGNSVG